MHADSEVPDQTPQETPADPTPSTSRRMAWVLATLLAVAALGIAVWGVRKVQSDRAIADVERSMADLRAPAAPAKPAGQAAPQLPVPPAELPQAATTAGVTTAATAPAGDRLPPLALPGQRVPAAVLRDVPEWVAAQVGAPVQTSGGSADESAAPPERPAAPARREPVQAQVQPRGGQRQYGAVFARCPGPGESGAVECRRAVCAGGARKSAACAPYLGE